MMPDYKYYWSHRQRCLEIAHKYYINNREECQARIKRYARQHRLSSGGMTFTVNKSPRPPDDTCELCGRISRKLNYHHWDNLNMHKGVWVCFPCHRMCEGIDKGLGRKYRRFQNKPFRREGWK